MGVVGLLTLMRNKKLCVEIDMRTEIKEFRRLQRKRHAEGANYANNKPIIIFDILSFVYPLSCGTVGMLGGRYKINLLIIEEFFKKLNDAGARLVFFCEGQIQDNKVDAWCDRKNYKFKKSMKLMEQGSAKNYDQFFSNAFLQSVLKLIEDKNFGEIRMSTEVECDRAIAKYAVEFKQDTLAVVTCDTDMLIFDGDFFFWHIDSIGRHIKQCRAEHLDRKKLLQELKLSRDQMKIFATVRGNDFTKRFSHYDKNLDDEIARCIKAHFHNYVYNVNCYENVAEMILWLNHRNRIVVNRADLIESVEKSLKFYQLDFVLQPVQRSGRINLFKNCMENGEPLQYDVQFLDFKPRNGRNEKFVDILLKAFRRMLGILVQQQPDNEHLSEMTIITKTDRDEKYQAVKLLLLSPIFPWCEQNEDVKWKYLLYGLGLQLLPIEDLKKIAQSNKGIIMNILAVLFQLKVNEITEEQADILLVVHCNILMEKVTLCFLQGLAIPSHCQDDTIRTAHAFLKTFDIVNDFFDVCRLQKHRHTLSYDGVYYNYLTIKLHGGQKTTEKQLKDCLGNEVKTIYDRSKSFYRNGN